MHILTSPLFFPFTVLTGTDALILSLLFQKIDWLSTESSAERSISKLNLNEVDTDHQEGEERFFPLVIPEKLLGKISASLAGYKEWATLNKGAGKGYLKSTVRENPYFTSDTDISAIQYQIVKNIKNHSDVLQNNDLSGVGQDGLDANFDELPQTLQKSLLFLRLAHQSDLEQELLDHQLELINASEADLFSQLKGQADLPAYSSGGFASKDKGALMTEERLNAWSAVMKQQKMDGSNPLLVTTSPAVVNFLNSVSEKSKLILDIDPIKVHKETCSLKDQWQENFYRALEIAIRGGEWQLGREVAADACCQTQVDLKLYLLSGEHVQRLLRFSQPDDHEIELTQSSGEQIPVLLVDVKK